MKLIVAIIHNEDAGALVDGLLEKEYRATRLHSSGGFLKQSTVAGEHSISERGVLAMLQNPTTDTRSEAASHSATWLKMRWAC